VNDLLRAILNLPVEASTYARGVDTLHYIVITCTMGGATFVFLLGLYFMIRYHRRAERELTPHVQAQVSTEVMIVTGILTMFLAFWVVGDTQYSHIMTVPRDAMPIYVMGKQWMWKFSYPDGRSSIDELVVPAHTPIKLVMTSRDVIHSFFVPAFRLKHDVVPGRYYTAWFEATTPGVYDINCAELCGVSHSRMLGHIRVLSQEDYRDWLEGKPHLELEQAKADTAQGGGDMVDIGRQVMLRRGCASCHTIDGQPHVGPTFAGLYGSTAKLTDGRTVVVDEAYLTKSMMDPNADVVAGYKPVMPTFMGALDSGEVAALVELIKSLRTSPFTPTVQLPPVVPVGSPPASGVAQPQAPQGPQEGKTP
jgi:cytochrome c oxidase subunit 2